jgi:hypothetical protein
MQKPAGLRSAGFRILAGGLGAFRDWAMRTNLSLTINKACIRSGEILAKSAAGGAPDIDPVCGTDIAPDQVTGISVAQFET